MGATTATTAARAMTVDGPLGSHVACTIDRLQCARVSTGRWETDIAEAARPAYLILFPLAGDVRDESGSRLVAVGELIVIDETRKRRRAWLVSQDALVVALPREALGTHEAAIARAHGTRIPAERGAASLVAHLLRGLAHQSEAYVSRAPGRLASHVVGLLALVCAEHGLSETHGRQGLLHSAKSFIETNLADIELGPDRIAAAQNVSTRTLHRLFEADGHTIGGWIRLRRLEQCRLDLSDPALLGLSVSAIGARWGLWDAAHFSRVFKLAFGTSPSAFRQSQIRSGEDALARKTA